MPMPMQSCDERMSCILMIIAEIQDMKKLIFSHLIWYIFANWCALCPNIMYFIIVNSEDTSL